MSIRLTPAVRSLAGVAFVLAAGCSDAPPVPTTCTPTRTFFEEQVWGPILAQDCLGCHSAQGQAKDSALVLQSAAQPGYLDANLAAVREVAAFEYGGESVLLLRPTMRIPHAGGQRFEVGSARYRVLAELVERLGAPVACEDDAVPEGYADVAYADALTTLRRAALDLVGRLPTPEEEASVVSDGEAGLEAALDAMMEEVAFLARVQEIWNDKLLTDRYLGGDDAVNLLSGDDYPHRRWWDDEDYAVDDATRATGDAQANAAVAREPLTLIAWVVAHDRPFTEILTADYTLVNPLSARVYGVEAALTFDDPADPTEYHEVRLPGVPHAGVLTSPMFLNRFPTTATNRNRHRSRMIFDLFLATDILTLAERPIDPTAIVDHNPTMFNPNCAVCHVPLDPVAGTFRNWDAQGRYRPPEEGWYADMRPPGFGEVALPPDQTPQALRWLAQQITRDARFPRAIVHIVYRGLLGRAPLSPPTDAAAPGYAAALRAFNAQDAALAQLAAGFVAADFSFKALVRAFVVSELYRADDTTAPLDALLAADPEREAELASLGSARLLTPEALDRKIEAVTGYPWRSRSWRPRDLLGDYRLFYGGIDSRDVITRISEPNGIMAAVAWRMANEVACEAVSRDFSVNRADRRLFREVEISFVPEDDNGFVIAGAEAAIKANLQALHQRVLGETLDLRDPELERTWRLFLDTWREGRAAVEAGDVSRDLDWECQARDDYWTGAELNPDKQVRRDDRYTVRAWMAVMSYLLSDFRFLHP